jgi:large subunit ribosomal protein L3
MAMVGLIGTKVGMTQIFGEGGEVIPVTVVEAGPATITQIRTAENDGYEAIQIGFGVKQDKLINKAKRGHLAKSGKQNLAKLAEFRVGSISEYEVGQEIKAADIVGAGDVVDVTGTSRGRGFSGVIRRYSFQGQSATHGTHESFRGPGAVGACAYPGRIWKGQKMPGQMGNKRRTVQNLVVVAIREEENLVLIRGGVPGPRGGEVLIRPAVKAQGKLAKSE